MKKGKPEVVQARVDEGMRLKIKKMTEKLDCSEATVIRLALKKFFVSNGNKSITLWMLPVSEPQNRRCLKIA